MTISKAYDTYHIIAEPGDMTRYDFIVHRDGPDNFTFAQAMSTFQFPQRILWWDVAHLDIRLGRSLENATEIRAIADKYRCAPATVLTCVKAMFNLKETE